jgi:hypothetical protein
MTKICKILLLFIFLVSTFGCQPRTPVENKSTATPSSQVNTVGHREYFVHQSVNLANTGQGEPEKQNIWIALIGDFPPYQEVQSMAIAPNKYSLVTDEYGNQYAEFDFSGQPAGITQTISIDYRVTVNELTYNLATCQGELVGEFIQPELHIESANPQIRALANSLSDDEGMICTQVRAFYDYIDDHLVYAFNGENWGAQAAMGPRGSDCTESASLLAALSRAKGIPSRYFEGLLYLDEGTSKIAKTEHAWVDVYLPSVGWTAMDPTLGRFPLNRDNYFAHYSPDHIIVTMGASPSVLRGSSYWTHLYWPGDSTLIKVDGDWQIEPAVDNGQ